TEGNAVHGSVTLTDQAGNSATFTTADFKIDKTKPTISGSLSPASPASTGWYNISTGAPTYSYSASDALSGLASPATSSYIFGETSGQTKTFTVYDAAGNSNSVTSAAVKVDLTAPTLAF